MYYVYIHRRKSDKKVFYVGKGSGKRAYSKSGRSQQWIRNVSKHDYTVEIVFDNLTEEEAFQCEIDTILEMKYFGEPLCNHTSGGEGCSGRKLSDDHKYKLSEVQRKLRLERKDYSNNLICNRKGYVKSREHLDRIGSANRGRIQTVSEIEKRKETLRKLDVKADKQTYLFYSDTDIFVGTRKQLAEYSGIDRRCFRNLFAAKPSLSAKGWSVMTNLQILILRNI